MTDDLRSPHRATRTAPENTTVEIATAAAPANRDDVGARLVVLSGTQQGRRYPVRHDTHIGRDASCDVVLGEAAVSRVHAIIVRAADGTWEIVDNGSRNGTFVRGVRATRERIQFGDHVKVGETVLLFSHVDTLEERILHRQKLEAIGRLGAGIAHDINNILAGVLANAEYIAELEGTRTLNDPDVVEALRDLRTSAGLGSELTKRILTLAKRGLSEHQQVDLSGVVHEAVALAQRAFLRNVRIEAATGVRRDVNVRGDKSQLHQVLMNLLLNARDAMPNGGTIRITLDYDTSPDTGHGEVAIAGRHAMITVEDSGIGMDEATAARVFEPFFTTKGHERGSGLGLSNVLEIVTAHGGTVTCESQVGKGTRFRVLLPALVTASRPERATPMAAMRRTAESRPATVLLVDDEPLTRRSIARVLARDGHQVVVAGDGREALAQFAPGRPPIDVVLMDLDMPELDGQAAQREMAKQAPRVPVIILTGFVEQERRQELLEAGVYQVLTKPCGSDALRSAVRAALLMSAPA